MDDKTSKEIVEALNNLKLTMTKHFSKGFHKLGKHRGGHGQKNLNKTLFIIYKKGEMTPTELGELMDVRKSTLTAIVELLTEKDFVVVEGSQNDKRKKIIKLTDKGIEQARGREDIVKRVISEVLKQLDSDRVEELVIHLKGINDILGSLED